MYSDIQVRSDWDTFNFREALNTFQFSFLPPFKPKSHLHYIYLHTVSPLNVDVNNSIFFREEFSALEKSGDLLESGEYEGMWIFFIKSGHEKCTISKENHDVFF